MRRACRQPGPGQAQASLLSKMRFDVDFLMRLMAAPFVLLLA